MGRNCGYPGFRLISSLVEISMNSRCMTFISVHRRTLSRGHPACGPLLGRALGQVVSGYCCDRGAGRPAGVGLWAGHADAGLLACAGHCPGSSERMQSPAGTQVRWDKALGAHRPTRATRPWGRLWSSCLKKPMPVDRPQMWHVTASDREGRGWGWRERPSAKFTHRTCCPTSRVGGTLQTHLSRDLTLENRVGSSAGTSLWGPLGQSVGFINSLTHTFQVRPAAVMESCPQGLSLHCTYTDQQVLGALLPSRHPAARAALSSLPVISSNFHYALGECLAY